MQRQRKRDSRGESIESAYEEDRDETDETGETEERMTKVTTSRILGLAVGSLVMLVGAYEVVNGLLQNSGIMMFSGVFMFWGGLFLLPGGHRILRHFGVDEELDFFGRIVAFVVVYGVSAGLHFVATVYIT